MKRKFVIIAMVLTVTLFLLTIPFYLDENYIKALSVGSDFIGTISSIITLIIALLLFNKYGIEKSILEKKESVVFDLLLKVNQINFFLKNRSSIHLISLRRDIRDKSWKRLEEDGEVVFSTHYWKGLDYIWEFLDNIFLPKEIAEKLSKVSISRIDRISLNPKCYKILIGGFTEDPLETIRVNGEVSEIDKKNIIDPFRVDIDDDNLFGIANGKKITIGEFMQLWEDVINSCKEWIQENSSISTELNI